MTEIELNAEFTLWTYYGLWTLLWIHLGFYLDLAPWYINLVLGSLHYPWSMNLAGVTSGLATSMTTLAGLTVKFTPIFSLVQMPGGVLKTAHLCHDCDCQFLDCHTDLSGARD